MADNNKRFIAYGDKRFELDAGMTLDQAKDIMARHFPELADPQIDTKKEDGATVYVFSKKAGRKGASLNRICLQLLKAKPAPAPDIMAAAALGIYQPAKYQPAGAQWPAVGEVPIEEINAQMDEGLQVGAVRQALLAAPSAMPFDGTVLL